MALRARAFFCFSLREEDLFSCHAAHADQRGFWSREVNSVWEHMPPGLAAHHVGLHRVARQLPGRAEEAKRVVEAAVFDRLVGFFYQVTGWPGRQGFG